MEKIVMTFAEILKHYMGRNGLNNNQLAERLETTRQTIGNWVNGTIQRPDCEKIRKCIEVFGLKTQQQKEEFLTIAGCLTDANTVMPVECPLSKNLNEFVKQLKEHFESSLPVPLLLLSQHEHPLLVDTVFTCLADAYPLTHRCRIALPAVDHDEDNFYNILAHRCYLQGCRHFQEPVNKSSEFERRFNEQVSQAIPFFLFIYRFENASQARAKELGGILRSVWEQYHHLHLILCGAQKLEELKYLQGEHSLLNHAEICYVPELTVEDVQWMWHAKKYSESPLDSQVANFLLHISGGHSDWLARCAQWYQQEPESLEKYPEKLSLTLCDLFLPFIHQNGENVKNISEWLEKDRIAPKQYFITHPLLRDLFWKNFLVNRRDGIYWRCEAVRLAGKEALKKYAEQT